MFVLPKTGRSGNDDQVSSKSLCPDHILRIRRPANIFVFMNEKRPCIEVVPWLPAPDLEDSVGVIIHQSNRSDLRFPLHA